MGAVLVGDLIHVEIGGREKAHKHINTTQQKSTCKPDAILVLHPEKEYLFLLVKCNDTKK